MGKRSPHRQETVRGAFCLSRNGGKTRSRTGRSAKAIGWLPEQATAGTTFELKARKRTAVDGAQASLKTRHGLKDSRSRRMVHCSFRNGRVVELSYLHLRLRVLPIPDLRSACNFGHDETSCGSCSLGLTGPPCWHGAGTGMRRPACRLMPLSAGYACCRRHAIWCRPERQRRCLRS